jgi:hypothetical protein
VACGGWIDPRSIDSIIPVLQEQADVATALLLTTWWRRIALEGVEDRAALQKEAEAVERMAGYKQPVALRENMNEQVLRMFKAIHAARQAQCECNPSVIRKGGGGVDWAIGLIDLCIPHTNRVMKM